jgi:magnesium transporter
MPTQILTHDRVTWTNIINPTEDDVHQLATRYPQFHELNLQDCLTESEFPKLDHQDDYLFLVAHMPVRNERTHIPRLAEVDIFITRGNLVTSHRGEIEALTGLWESAQTSAAERMKLMGHGASPLLYELLNALVNDCMPLIERMDRDIRHIEENLFSNDTRHILDEIAVIRRELIATRRILHPQVETIRQLAEGRWPFIHEELDPYWGDISDHLSQLGWTLDEQMEVVNGLANTIDTLASHRIDEVVRLLTVVTVITLPLTLLATIFGMNVALPFAEHPLLFFLIITLGLVVTMWLVRYLRRHRWM